MTCTIKTLELVGQLIRDRSAGTSAFVLRDIDMNGEPRAGTARLRAGDVVRFGPSKTADPMMMRREELTVSHVDATGAQFWTHGRKSWVAALCDDSDFVFVERAVEGAADIAALEAYLQSCVRRRDWHGASDAANDLRVLEAVHEAKR